MPVEELLNIVRAWQNLYFAQGRSTASGVGLKSIMCPRRMNLLPWQIWTGLNSISIGIVLLW